MWDYNEILTTKTWIIGSYHDNKWGDESKGQQAVTNEGDTGAQDNPVDIPPGLVDDKTEQRRSTGRDEIHKTVDDAGCAGAEFILLFKEYPRWGDGGWMGGGGWDCK